MIFIIKVITNKEERAVEMIADRAEKKNLQVFSVSRPHGLRGYILLEAEDRESAEEAVFNLPYIKGIIGKTISYEEIKNMIEPSITAVSIKDGDIVTLDTVIQHKGMFVDHAVTLGVGKLSLQRVKLLKITKKGLDETVKLVKDGIRVGVLSASMEQIAEENEYSVSKDYVGHGIGHEMHEEPQIPCFSSKVLGMTLKEGMTICIEPLYAQGTDKIKHKGYWVCETLDGKDFAQFEHTVLVTKNGFEILTK